MEARDRRVREIDQSGWRGRQGRVKLHRESTCNRWIVKGREFTTFKFVDRRQLRNQYCSMEYPRENQLYFSATVVRFWTRTSMTPIAPLFLPVSIHARCFSLVISCSVVVNLPTISYYFVSRARYLLHVEKQRGNSCYHLYKWAAATNTYSSLDRATIK